LSFIGAASGIKITDAEQAIFYKTAIELNPQEKIKVEMKPYGGFVIKIN
jgi:hypothetical protein